MVDLLQDMSRWFERCQGDPAAVRQAESALLADGQPRHTAFLRLVYRLFDDGKLTAERADFDRVRRTHAAIVDHLAAAGAPASIWVPMRSLNRLLGRLGSPAINPDLITKSLSGLPAFLGITEYRGEGGWCFDETSWTEQYQHHCRKVVAQ
jgi:hypothetical protein